MNEQAKTAFNQYKDLARAWQITNPDMAECASQLIQWINDNATGSTQETRQDVQAVNWESLLSGFPTDALQDELAERYKAYLTIPDIKPAPQPEYKEDLKISDTAIHTCGTYIIIKKWGDKYEASCNQCGVAGVLKDSEDQAIKAFAGHGVVTLRLSYQT